MTKSRLKKKQRTEALSRATMMTPVQYAPGGAMMYVPTGMAQSPLGQTYYGATLKNTPVGEVSLFSPGQPLPTQPNVNPGGLPVQWKFPVSYNSFPVDRSLGNPDVPSFELLKRLAQMDYGIGLCERYWLDLVPRMTVRISLTKEAVAGGAEEAQYTKESTYFKGFFSKPDGGLDVHSWLRSALINQSRYDELYLYKNRTRGGKLLGLEIIDGSQMKPLLDDWGRLPPPPRYAYQQYPWGIPGWMYTQDQMTHYRESPASDTPYGFSRIERILIMTNLALRKIKQDLAHYTEGNIPAGILMPPAGSNWTPDQLDSYEQSWNALIAGNLQQLARIKVVQPGFTYTPFVQPNFDSVFDRFMLNIRTAAYGMTMSDLGFTETVNKSSGDSQENVSYRRTIGPIAMIYAMLLTDVMQHDFEPSLHGDLFELTFGGYEEAEDLSSNVAAYANAAQNGLIGLSDASKALSFPEPKDGKYIGRVLITKSGPMFLDDEEMMDAQRTATLAGLQMAAQHPVAPGASTASGGDDDDEDNDEEEETAPDAKETKAPSKGKAPATPSAAKTTSKGNAAAQPAPKKVVGKQQRAVDSGEGDEDTVAPSQHTGIMVAFALDPGVAQQLALPGGEAPEALHLTLAYLGNTTDPATVGTLHPAETPEVIRSVLKIMADYGPVLRGTIGGLARFTPSESSDDLAPVIALVNVPGLQDFRRRLVNALSDSHYSVASDFDYSPHITLAYINPYQLMPVNTLEPLPLTLDTLMLAIGDDVTLFPMGGHDVTRTQQNTEAAPHDPRDLGRGASQASATRASTSPTPPGAARLDRQSDAAIDYRRWRTRAIEDAKLGKKQRGFTSVFIPSRIHDDLTQLLSACTTPDDIRTVFARAQSYQDSELVGAEPRLEYNAALGIWEAADTEDQLAAMAKQGTKYLQWHTSVSPSGVCPLCAPNDGQIVEIGKPFKSGHRLPQCHAHCGCTVDQLTERPKH